MLLLGGFFVQAHIKNSRAATMLFFLCCVNICTTTAVPLHVTMSMPFSAPTVLYWKDTPITALAPSLEAR